MERPLIPSGQVGMPPAASQGTICMSLGTPLTWGKLRPWPAVRSPESGSSHPLRWYRAALFGAAFHIHSWNKQLCTCAIFQTLFLHGDATAVDKNENPCSLEAYLLVRKTDNKQDK